MGGLTIDELRPVLADAVDALPERERKVITALYWEGLHPAEIARQTGMSPRTVRRVRDSAMRRIRGLTDV